MPTPNDEPRPPGVSPTWRTVALGLACGLFAYTAAGWHHERALRADDVPAVREVAPPAVDPVLDAVDFDGVRLADAVATLTRQAGLNLVCRWDDIASADLLSTPVTLHLRRVTFAVAMDTLLDPVHGTDRLGWDERGGVVTVAERSALDTDPSRVVLRVYDVAPLLDRLPQAPPPATNQTQGALFLGQQYGPTDAQIESQRGDELKQLVMNNVDPESWKDNGGQVGTASVWAKQLIVTQSERTHRRIEAFLQLFRHRGG